MQQTARDDDPGDSRPVRHCQCGEVGTEWRSEIKTLDGYGRAYAARRIEHVYCYACAVAYDARQLALQAGQQSRPAVAGIALLDQESARHVPTWEAVLGICTLLRQIPAEQLRALLSEYDRGEETLGLLQPETLAAYGQNLSSHRAITAATLALREAIARHGGG